MTHSNTVLKYNLLSLRNSMTTAGRYSRCNHQEATAFCPKCFFVKEINGEIQFKEIFPVKYKIEDGCFFVHFTAGKLLIEVAEDNYLSMVEDFKSEVSDYWDYLSKETDGNLTEGARKAKQWLLSNIEEISCDCC